MIANTMELSVTASEIITGSFDMLGLGGEVSATGFTGGTYNLAPTAEVLSASGHVGSLVMSSLVSPKLRTISLSVTNNLAGANVVGSMDYADIGAGQFGVSGNIEAYFETRHMYEKFLAARKIRQSFSRVGMPGDNVWSESFFASLKKEIVHRVRFATKEDARQAIFGYIEVFYNSKRVQERLGYLSPIQWFERWDLELLGRVA